MQTPDFHLIATAAVTAHGGGCALPDDLIAKVEELLRLAWNGRGEVDKEAVQLQLTVMFGSSHAAFHRVNLERAIDAVNLPITRS